MLEGSNLSATRVGERVLVLERSVVEALAARRAVVVPPGARARHREPGRSLAGVEDAARDAIGLWLDVDPMSFDIHVTVRTPAEAAELWEAENRRDAEARDAAAAARRFQAGGVPARALIPETLNAVPGKRV